MAMMCSGFMLTAMATDLSVTGLDSSAVDLEVNSGSPWVEDTDWSDEYHVAYKAGNSGSTVASVSNMSITVTEPGSITFDYRISTEDSGSGGYSYGLFYQLNDPIEIEGNEGADNYGDVEDYIGEVAWSTQAVTVLESDLVDGSATLYIAYHRGGTRVKETNENKVAVANISFSSGNREVTISSTDGGSVSGDSSGEKYVGSTVSLTATADSGKRFYGWLQNGEFVGDDTSYSFIVTDTTEIEAVFATDGTYTVRGGGTFYTGDDALATALNDAEYGDSVMVLESIALSSSAIVPEYVTLYIPYDSSYDSDGSQDGGKDGYTASGKITTSNAYRTLTINSGVTLTVDGTLTIGGVISFPSTDYQGHTSGAHGEIVNNGDINVNGSLESYGFVTGSGDVTIQDGGKLYEPFIVLDYTGGTNTLAIVSAMQSPFKHYAMQNVQTTLTLASGSSLYGYCNLYAGSSYNKTIAPIIANGDSLFKTTSNTEIVRTYDGSKTTSTYSDIGTTSFEVSGGMTFQSLTLEIFGFEVTTAHVEFPIPYNYQFDLSNGDYYVTQGLNLLPGASIYVDSDATFTVKGGEYVVGTTSVSVDDIDEDGNYIGSTTDNVDVTMNPRFYVMDGLTQSPLSGSSYPSDDELAAGGFAKSAEFIVDGTMTIENEGIFGGIVQTTGSTGTIIVESGASVTDNELALGGFSSYDDNRAYLTLSGRVYTGEITDMIAGTTYSANGGEAFTLERYYTTYMVASDVDTYNAQDPDLEETDIGYVSNSGDSTYHILVGETITINQAMTGIWVAGDTANMSEYVVEISTDKTDIRVGDTVTATLMITGEEAFADVTFTVTYNGAVLEYKNSDFVNSDYFGLNSQTENKLIVTGSALDNGEYDVPYTIGTVTFTAIAEINNTSLSLSGASVNPIDADAPTYTSTGDAVALTISESDGSVTETTPETSVTDNTATTTVDEDVIIKSDEEFTIYATTEENTTATEVTIPKSVVSQISNATDLNISTDSGVVTFNSTALDEIATTESDVTLKVSVADDETENIVTVTLELVNSNDDKVAFAGENDQGNATITVLYEATNGENVKVYYVDGDGEKEEITNASYDNGYVTFTTTHFSDYQILEVSDESVYTLGDLNGDEIIDTKDLTILTQATLNIIELSEEQIIIADLYNDGVIDTKDLTKITQYVLNIITSFEEQEKV